MYGIIIGHITAFFAGFVLDLIFGDPYNMPHPVRLIGRLIGFFDKLLGPPDIEESGHKSETDSEGHISVRYRIRGFFLWVMIEIICIVTVTVLIFVSYRLNLYAGIALEAVLTYYFLALKCMYDESNRVRKDITESRSDDDRDLDKARYDLSMIVGRDTDVLDKKGIIKAVIETIAESTSDGVIAPMFYLAIGGPILGVMYKAANTMDSMIGYKSARYIDLGRFAAKADDVLNLIPSRLCALLIMVSSGLLLGKDAAKRALTIYRRDRNLTPSPNAGQCESAMAGAIGIKLAGDTVYGGVTVHKAYIGDDDKEVSVTDIETANRLMIASAVIMTGVSLIFMCIGGKIETLYSWWRYIP